MTTSLVKPLHYWQKMGDGEVTRHWFVSVCGTAPRQKFPESERTVLVPPPDATVCERCLAIVADIQAAMDRHPAGKGRTA